MKLFIKIKVKIIKFEEKYFFNKQVFIHLRMYIYGHTLYGHTLIGIHILIGRVEGSEAHGVFFFAPSKMRNNAAFLHFLL